MSKVRGESTAAPATTGGLGRGGGGVEVAQPMPTRGMSSIAVRRDGAARNRAGRPQIMEKRLTGIPPESQSGKRGEGGSAAQGATCR